METALDGGKGLGDQDEKSEQQLLSSLALKKHESMSLFEKETIEEIEKRYPLDGRNLSLGRKVKRSRHRLVEKDSADIIVEEQVSPEEHLVGDVLFDFQKVGVAFLVSKYHSNTGGLLADEMGLGKSVQVIFFLAQIWNEIQNPVLLICPSTLIAHWKQEFRKWDSQIEVFDFDLSNVNKAVYIISYESYRSRLNSKKIYSVMILDEAQRIRNPFSKITLAVKQTNCYCRIALSGSPIQNNLTELWSIIDFVSPGKLGTLATFQEELATPIEEGTRSNASYYQMQLSVKCAILLRDLTRSCMLRRLKSEQLSATSRMRGKEEKVLFCQLSDEQVEIYCQFLSSETVLNCIRKKHKSFYSLSILRRISNHPDLLLSSKNDVDDYGSVSRSGKLSVLVSLLKVWQREKLRCLVFSQSLALLDILELRLNELGMTWDRMDGQTSLTDRTRVMAQWDSSETGGPFCLLLSTRVGGVGLNLIGASRVVIFDPDWNPMTDAQARERSWRIGQTRDVKIYRLVAAETIEEIICKRQIYKHHLAKKVLIDPRQGKMSDWDNDYFRRPNKSGKSGGEGKNVTTKKIISLFRNLNPDTDLLEEEEERGPDELVSLVTKVWNQDEIEMPKLCASLVDSSTVDAAAARAIQAVISEAPPKSDITVPTNTKKQSASQSILASLANTGRVRFDALVIEKHFVEEIRNIFKNRKDISTDEIVRSFNVPEGHSEIFRSCLRQLCDFDNGSWSLKKNIGKNT